MPPLFVLISEDWLASRRCGRRVSLDMRFTTTGLLLGGLGLSLASAEPLSVLAKGFKRPVAVVPHPIEKADLWVVEQHGEITAIDRRSGERKGQVIDISKKVSRKGNEEGLLSLVFDPAFAKNGRFYVNYTDRSKPKALTHISMFEDGKETSLLSFAQDFRNHNGGWMDFGPDGNLYIGTGDGGSANDPKNRAQDPQSYLGKLLRIRPSGTGYSIPKGNLFPDGKAGKKEIYAIGLRNPWRCHFDQDGSLWLADVGQYHLEEVNHVPAESLAGANFGWRLREGTVENPNGKIGGQEPTRAIKPVYQYGHGSGDNEGVSITGGVIYRGKDTALHGKYLFADYANPRIWALDPAKNYAFSDLTDTISGSKKPGAITSFATGHDGELYVIDHRGMIWMKP